MPSMADMRFPVTSQAAVTPVGMSHGGTGDGQEVQPTAPIMSVSPELTTRGRVSCSPAPPPVCDANDKEMDRNCAWRNMRLKGGGKAPDEEHQSRDEERQQAWGSVVAECSESPRAHVEEESDSRRETTARNGSHFFASRPGNFSAEAGRPVNRAAGGVVEEGGGVAGTGSSPIGQGPVGDETRGRRWSSAATIALSGDVEGESGCAVAGGDSHAGEALSPRITPTDDLRRQVREALR